MSTQNTMWEAGYAAYWADGPAAPILNPVVVDAIADRPVGDGAAELMAAYTRGWQHAADEAFAESIGAMDWGRP